MATVLIQQLRATPSSPFKNHSMYATPKELSSPWDTSSLTQVAQQTYRFGMADEFPSGQGLRIKKKKLAAP